MIGADARNRRIAPCPTRPSRDALQYPGVQGPARLWVVLALVLLLILAVAWVGIRGVLAKGDLERAVRDVDTLRSQLARGDSAAAQQTAVQLEDEAGAPVADG